MKNIQKNKKNLSLLGGGGGGGLISPPKGPGKKSLVVAKWYEAW